MARAPFWLGGRSIDRVISLGQTACMKTRILIGAFLSFLVAVNLWADSQNSSNPKGSSDRHISGNPANPHHNIGLDPGTSPENAATEMEMLISNDARKDQTDMLRDMQKDRNNKEKVRNAVRKLQNAHFGTGRTETVDQNKTVTVHHGRTETTDNNENISVHHGRTETVDNNQTITIGGKHRTQTVDQNETITVGKGAGKGLGHGRLPTLGHSQSVSAFGSLKGAKPQVRNSLKPSLSQGSVNPGPRGTMNSFPHSK